MDLASVWESRLCIRARANGRITMWTKKDGRELVGVVTSPCCSLNAVPLTLMASWWVSQRAKPGTVPIDQLRMEA